MAQEHINLGTPPAGVDGDTNRAAWQKAEDNFTDLYSFFGGQSPTDILAEIEQNTSDIATLKPEVAQNTSDLVTVKPAVTQNTNDIATLKPQVAQNTTDITNIKTNTTFAGGSLTVGANALAASAIVYLNAAAAQARNITIQTAGLSRWTYGAGVSVESGSNVGSDFTINRYTDAGVLINQPLTIFRATGYTSFNSPVGLATPYGYFGVVDTATVAATAPASWTAAKAYGMWLAQNAEYSSGAWHAQNVTNTPCAFGLTTAGGITLQAGSAVPASVGAVVPLTNVFSVSNTGAVVAAANITGNSLTSNGNISAGGTIGGAGLSASSTSTNSTTVQINNTSSGGHSWAVGVAGTSGVATAPAGSFVFYDNSASALRGWIDTNGVFNVTTNGLAGSVNITDTGASGACLWLKSAGSYPNKMIRARNSNLEMINSANSLIMVSVNDFNTACSMVVAGGLYPSADNAFPLGQASGRWTTVYAASGTINTCDARDKENLGLNSLGLDFVKALPVNWYRYLVGQKDPKPLVDENGEAILDENGDFQTVVTPIPGTRTHVGPMAQDVAAALTAAGVDPSTMGMWALADPNKPDSRQALRENELMWVLWSAVQQLAAKVEALEAAAA